MKMKSGAIVDGNNDKPLPTDKGEAESLTYWRHEIMARLTVITLGSSMLRETLGETLSERQLVLLATIEHSTDDLSELIKELLDFRTARESATPAT